jgi:hypothetical protein
MLVLLLLLLYNSYFLVEGKEHVSDEQCFFFTILKKYMGLLWRLGSCIDQRNSFECLHVSEKIFFERALEFFFDDHNGCYVLDDELIGSKVGDIESKVATEREAGGEGPVCDAICDSFFQIVLRMR